MFFLFIGCLSKSVFDTNGVWAIFPKENCLLDNCTLDDCPKDYFLPGQLLPRIIAPEENCPPGWLPPGWLLPENYPKDIWPLAIPPRNCNQVPFGWFVAYIIAPWKTPPRNIVHRINYTQYIFSPRIRNRSTLIDSCFLLFSFFCGLN